VCWREARKRYRSRLSGPLIDRLDIHVSVPPVEVAALTRSGKGESSADVRARVTRARDVQRERAVTLGISANVNAGLAPAELGVSIGHRHVDVEGRQALPPTGQLL
jgi:magnesium chelatase family protein